MARRSAARFTPEPAADRGPDPASAAAVASPDVSAAPDVRPSPPARRRRLETASAICARALLLWPGLDRRSLSRAHGDPRKIAHLVARRTIHSEEAILLLLLPA